MGELWNADIWLSIGGCSKLRLLILNSVLPGLHISEWWMVFLASYFHYFCSLVVRAKLLLNHRHWTLSKVEHPWIKNESFNIFIQLFYLMLYFPLFISFSKSPYISSVWPLFRICTFYKRKPLAGMGSEVTVDRLHCGPRLVLACSVTSGQFFIYQSTKHTTQPVNPFNFISIFP